MNYSLMTPREVEIELSTSVGEGLSSFTAHDKLIDNGRNLPEKSYAKSVTSVILSQFTNLYTVAFFVMGIITAVCDFKNSMAAWIIFFAVAVVNMVSGFLRDNQDRQIAVEFDTKRSDQVKIIRDSQKTTIDPTLLVKGDIVILEQGDFVPADIRILECENLKADESIFKGRNIPIDKHSEKLDEEADMAECANILYCGSIIASGSATGVVVGAGKDTVLAKVNANKSRKLDMHDKFGKNASSEKILMCAAILSAMVVLVVTNLKTSDFKLSMLQSCAVALCLLPAPVFIVRMLAVKIASIRIKSKNVTLEHDDFVFDIGMGEYFLFDKGGLLTNNEMKLEEKVLSNPKWLDMAVICSDCEYKAGVLSGNEMDKATANALIEEGADVEKILKDNEKILFMPFDETRKLMAVVTKTDSGYRIIVKGTVESIPALCSSMADGDNTIEMSGELLHRLETISSAMAEKGLKIRAIAYRDLEHLPENIEEEIKSLVFVGILGYREFLAKKARESVKKIESIFVKPVMVTGDHKITAATFARSAGLIKSEDECVSFRELGECTDEELLNATDKYKVFTSASNQDRERIVKVLSEKGYVTIVAGEQMTSPSVAMYANVTVCDENSAAGDVLVANSDIEHVSDVIYKARATRGNLAYASLLAISVGLAEVLVMLYMLLTGNITLPTSKQMLLLNLFVVFLPCFAVSVFAGVHQKVRAEKELAFKSVLQGLICALLCMASGSENMMIFIALYAILQAISICVSYTNLEKGKLGIPGAILMVLLLVGTIILKKVTTVVIICALLATVVNGILSHLKLKGLKK